MIIHWSSSCCTTKQILRSLHSFAAIIGQYLNVINDKLLLKLNRCRFCFTEVNWCLHCIPPSSTLFPSAMQCLTTLTGLCALRGRTSVFSYQVRVVQVKQRPPRRSSSTTQSLALLMIAWLPLVIAYCSLILFWRYLAHQTFFCLSQYFMLLSE